MLGASPNKYILFWTEFRNTKNLGAIAILKFKKQNNKQAFLVAQMVKNLPAEQETWVRSLGWEDPLEEGMATHSSILAWRIPMDRKAWQATIHRLAKS